MVPLRIYSLTFNPKAKTTCCVAVTHCCGCAFYFPIVHYDYAFYTFRVMQLRIIYPTLLGCRVLNCSDGENTLDSVFKILWPKYIMYFLYFNNKIQNTVFTENYYIIQTSFNTLCCVIHAASFIVGLEVKKSYLLLHCWLLRHQQV